MYTIYCCGMVEITLVRITAKAKYVPHELEPDSELRADKITLSQVSGQQTTQVKIDRKEAP